VVMVWLLKEADVVGVELMVVAGQEGIKIS
jgi:hypothetical protein